MKVINFGITVITNTQDIFTANTLSTTFTILFRTTCTTFFVLVLECFEINLISTAFQKSMNGCYHMLDILK